MARILITTFGSYGDLFPYLAVGTELTRLGHEVTLATSAAYQVPTEAAGLRFAPVRPDVDLADREFLDYIFDARRGTERIIRAMSDLIRDTWEDTAAAAAGADVILTHPLTFAATLFAKKHRVPWVATVLAPVSFLSASDPPVPANAPWLRHLAPLGPGFYRWFWSIGRRIVLGWTQPVIDFARRELGLTTGQIGHPLFDGAMSPHRTLGLFSPVFGPPQPDWPAAAVATGFPFYDNQPSTLTPELEAFLAAGPPPVVFTLGSSAVGAAGPFYRDSFRAAETLGVRTLFLTGSHPQGLPDKLPDHMLACAWAPHSAVFPRAAAIVHQGGIGTTAEALRAGRPMLVVPFAHDQFDNAERCRRLGVGRWIRRSAFRPASAERELNLLLGDPHIASRCASVGSQIAAEHGARRAAELVARFTTC